MSNDQQKKFGADGEDDVRAALRALSGQQISGFFRTENLVCAGRQVQLDFLVLVPHIGLLVIEVKTWKGRIYISGQDKWKRELPNCVNHFGNGALQAVRASGLVLQMLEQERCNHWPIRSLVIFPSEKTELLFVNNEHPQADVIYLHQLSDWINKNRNNHGSKSFSAQDFSKIKSVLSKYYAPFDPKLNE